MCTVCQCSVVSPRHVTFLPAGTHAESQTFTGERPAAAAREWAGTAVRGARCRDEKTDSCLMQASPVMVEDVHVLRQLRQRAEEMGVPADKIEAARDEDDEKGAMIKLITAQLITAQLIIARQALVDAVDDEVQVSHARDRLARLAPCCCPR